MNPATTQQDAPANPVNRAADGSRSIDPGRTISSAIYEGTVFHRRYEPIEHGFDYRIFLPLFDLDELPGLFDGIPMWSADPARPAPAHFRRADYLKGIAPAEQPLADTARDLVAARGASGSRPGGPVKLLANPRYWGIAMNPVAFYYLYGEGEGAGVEAMIAEVTNTPWGERRCYVLEIDGSGEGDTDGSGLGGNFDKQLHVSPFMPMEQSYSWRANEPGAQLSVSLSNHQDGRRVFEAGVSLRRLEITPRAMQRLLFSYPPMTISTLGRIYWQALKLKVKGAPYFRNPNSDKDGSK